MSKTTNKYSPEVRERALRAANLVSLGPNGFEHGTPGIRQRENRSHNIPQ